MKRFLTLFLLVSVVSAAAADCCKSDNYSFYIKVGSGISCSECANIIAPYPPWNPAVQGYNAALGNRAIASVSVGCELVDILDIEVNLSNRSHFKYRKFQTPTTGGDSYTRMFDLDVTSIFFSTNILGRGIPYCHWECGCSKLYPIIGAAVGSSHLLITSYRTVGLAPSGDSSPYLSFSAENQYTMRKNFTYTLLAGVEYSYGTSWAMSTGYRWFNAGNFKGPRYQRVANGSAVDVGCDAWNMRFRSNEWFIEFKIYI